MDLERPVTRWRRDTNSDTKTDDLVERPKSRRGVLYNENQQERGRASARPPSARAYSSYITSPSRGLDKMPGQTQRERLVSQQGLNVMRTATTRGQRARVIQDKRYFQSALQTKVGQLGSELLNIQKEIDRNSRDQASITVYDKRVKEMAMTLTDLQCTLADYNMAIDKINVGSDVYRILLEAKELASVNDADVFSLENLFSDRVRRQEVVKDLEEQIKKIKFKAEQLEAEMNNSQREQFNSLKSHKNELLSKVDKLQNEINNMNKKKSSIGDQVYISPVKSEYVQLELKMWELLNKKDNLLVELKTSLTPEEQRRELLNKVKQDNAQMTTMKKTINDINEQIKECEMALSQSSPIVDNNKSSRNAKYTELKNKETAIEDFLSTVEALKHEESDKLQNLGNEIVPLLKKMAEKIALVPTMADYKALQSNISAGSETLNTAKSIGIEHANVSRYLNKVEVMVKNVGSELDELKNKITTMNSEIKKYSNLKNLENEIETNRVFFTQQKNNLEVERPVTKLKFKDITTEYNDLQKKMVENENHAQISYAEKKLSNVEQSNFAMSEYLEDVKCEEDVEVFRTKALDIVQHLNKHHRNKLV